MTYYLNQPSTLSIELWQPSLRGGILEDSVTHSKTKKQQSLKSIVNMLCYSIVTFMHSLDTNQYPRDTIIDRIIKGASNF
jgi:hypothetical protein